MFNRVIIQSGSAFSCGGAFDEEVSASIARELSSLVGCAVTSSEEILNCLMSVKGEELLIKQWDLFVSTKKNIFSFGGINTIYGINVENRYGGRIQMLHFDRQSKQKLLKTHF